MKCPIYYSKLDPALHASAHHGAISSSPQVPNLVLQAAKALGQVGALPHYAKAKEPIKTALRAKLPDLRTGGTESDLDVAVDIEHASAHHGALPFPLPTGTESDLDVAVEIATALVALGEVRASDPKLEAALTYLEETHSLALKKEDAKAEAPS
jgi:predicted nucleotidyltransferase